mmetsp:Transcript_18987/g.36234  ORF Transcript_18987/g.36234 Transcript_18987/m.36234 type:complete len:204 (+) Transcript_18987:1826-2437(+)
MKRLRRVDEHHEGVCSIGHFGCKAQLFWLKLRACLSFGGVGLHSTLAEARAASVARTLQYLQVPPFGFVARVSQVQQPRVNLYRAVQMRAPDGGQWPPRRRIDRNLAIHVHAGLGTVVGDAAHAKPSEVRGVGKHVAVTLRHLAAEPLGHLYVELGGGVILCELPPQHVQILGSLLQLEPHTPSPPPTHSPRFTMRQKQRDGL